MIKRLTYHLLLILMFLGINMICNAQSVNEFEKNV